jgi:DNA-binding response OmpR family regulator
MLRILVVEDDPDIAALIKRYLEKAQFLVELAASGRDGLAALNDRPPDLLILDLMLPQVSGLEICRAARSDPRTAAVPIIMLTARAEESERIAGLETGADDYMGKPFSPRELLARIRALLRRARAQATVADEISKVRAFRFGKWELNVGLRKLKSPEGKAVELTNGEFSLLTAFLSSPQRVLTRDQLLDLSRLHNAEVYDRSIDVQILRLRRKIEVDPAHPEFIVTERGAGYVFASEVTPVR